MKTSVIEVNDLLSVLTVEEVEKRLEDVAGVESATVNYAAKNATVRFDETLLEVSDIKVLAHQRGQHPGESHAEDGKEDKPEHKPEHKPEEKPAVKPTPGAAPPFASPKADALTSATAPKPVASAGSAPKDKADPIAPPPDKK